MPLTPATNDVAHVPRGLEGERVVLPLPHRRYDVWVLRRLVVERTAVVLDESQNDRAEGLVERARRGDDEAARLLFERYASQLARVAGERLSRQVRRRVDGEDIAQSALRTFFRRIRAGEFAFKDSSDVGRLLVRLTIHKAASAARRHTAGIRNVTSEIHTNDASWLHSLSRDPDPVDAAVLAECLQQVLRELGRPEYVQILELTLDGQTKELVADRLGVSKRTVDRALERARSILERLNGEAGETEP